MLSDRGIKGRNMSLCVESWAFVRPPHSCPLLQLLHGPPPTKLNDKCLVLNPKTASCSFNAPCCELAVATWPWKSSVFAKGVLIERGRGAYQCKWLETQILKLLMLFNRQSHSNGLGASHWSKSSVSRTEWLHFAVHKCSAQCECTKSSAFLRGSLLMGQKVCIGS